MGIKDLNKNLIAINAIINNKHNNDLLKKLYPVFCKDNKNINGFVCHVDLSLLIYRFLYSFDNMEDVYQNLKNRLSELKEYNDVLLYLEPHENKRKEDTHKKRAVVQNKIKQGIQKSIEKEIELFDTFKNEIEPIADISLNQPLLDAIGFTNTSIKKQHLSVEEYNQKIEVINKEKDIYITQDIKTRDKLMLVEEFISEKKKNQDNKGIMDVYDKEYDIDIKNIQKPVITEDELEEYEEDELINRLGTDQKEYNVIKDKKQLFQFFLYETAMSTHHRYLRNRLLEENIIRQDDLIPSSSFDGEINIVDNIKKNFSDRKNLIISTDQDCILFSLLHHKTKYIYLKSSVLLTPEDITVIKNNNLTRNIAILTAFFNKTDYFQGVRNAGVTACRIIKYLEEISIFQYNLDLEEVVASFLSWFIKNKNNSYSNPVVEYEYMKSYFDNFKSYINLDEEFYKTNKNFERLEIDDVHNYFLIKDQAIPYIIDNQTGEITYTKYRAIIN
ncbi:putative FEN1-like nuclease [Yalta virus]|nr:putative FEN1-like nuclease [Yalta virus]